ncbi:cell surface protein, partial [Clostridium ljungdahlii]
MIKKKNTLGKFLSILAIICFMFSTFSSLPVLAEEASPSLTTDGNGEYVINSVGDINKFRTDLNKGIDYGNKKVVLNSDITITNDTQLTPTTGTFQGYFNGQGHSIKNYNDPLTGLVCKLGSYGIITNLHMNMNVSNANGLSDSPGETRYYGSIANESTGVISLCSVDGIVTTSSNMPADGSGFYIGGIVTCITKNETCDNCIVENCYSRLEIEGQTDANQLQFVAGIAYSVMSPNDKEVIKNCYAAGKMAACGVRGIANKKQAYFPSSYYDKDIVKATKDTYGGNAKSTDEMKQQATYAGWDFDKVWDIKSDTNDGYPYLKPNQTPPEPITIATDMPVDVNINIKDKTVNSDGTADLTADYTTSLTCSDQDSIASDNVKVTLDGKINFPGFTGNNVTMNYVPVNGNTVDLTSDVLKNHLQITYDDNKKYKFKIGNVTFNTPNFNGNGVTTVSEDKQKEQVENAKKAEDILYSKLGVGQSAVPEFTWSGDKTSTDGKDGATEGSVELNDYVWEVFSSARSGYSGVRAGFYDDWFKSVQDGLKKMKEAGVTPRDVKMTEWDKLVLAITAIGYDPRDIEAYDLIDIISNQDYLSTSNQTFSSQYALLGLNSYNYAIPSSGNRIDKEALIHEWAKSALGNKGADGSEVLSNAVPDMWLMTFQPIASYYGKEGYSDVTKAMDQVFAQFSNAQTYKGSFWGGMSGDYNNPWTNAQVYMTLGMTKSNIFDSKYIKNGNSILDGALEFYNIKDGTTTFDKSSYEPTQMCRGLDSLVRAYEGRNSIFDCTDVKNSTVPVNSAIAALPDADKLTSADKDKVDAAEKLYDALSDAQKSSMKQETVDKLTAAEKKVSPSQTVSVTGVSLDKT